MYFQTESIFWVVETHPTYIASTERRVCSISSDWLKGVPLMLRIADTIYERELKIYDSWKKKKLEEIGSREKILKLSLYQLKNSIISFMVCKNIICCDF